MRRGDRVAWHDDDAPSTVVFVVSTGDFAPEDAASRAWFQAEYGQGVMIDTPTAGWVLEDEDCGNISLVSPVGSFDPA